MTKGALSTPIWFNEFTAGGGYHGTPGRSRMYACLGLMMGTQGILAWTFNSHVGGVEQALFGLVDHDGTPSWKVEEFARIGAEFKQPSKFGFPRCTHPEVAIAYSIRSSIQTRALPPIRSANTLSRITPINYRGHLSRCFMRISIRRSSTSATTALRLTSWSSYRPFAGWMLRVRRLFGTTGAMAVTGGYCRGHRGGRSPRYWCRQPRCRAVLMRKINLESEFQAFMGHLKADREKQADSPEIAARVCERVQNLLFEGGFDYSPKSGSGCFEPIQVSSLQRFRDCRLLKSKSWWARRDLNPQPRDYESDLITVSC